MKKRRRANRHFPSNDQSKWSSREWNGNSFRLWKRFATGGGRRGGEMINEIRLQTNKRARVWYLLDRFLDAMYSMPIVSFACTDVGSINKNVNWQKRSREISSFFLPTLFRLSALYMPLSLFSSARFVGFVEGVKGGSFEDVQMFQCNTVSFFIIFSSASWFF